MSRKLRTFFGRVFLVCAMTALLTFESFAATARIAFSDPTASVGEEIRVTMKFSSTDGTVLGNTDVMLAYDATAMEYINETENASGGNGAIRVWSGLEGKTEVSTVLRFKALKAGTTQITVSSWEGYDNDGQSLTVEKEGTSTIQIAGLDTSSDDARLQSLQIYPGTLEPGFSPDTETYTTSVGLDVEKLTIDAKAANDKATVTVEGGSDLSEGANTVVCKVTAEDGTTVKTYTIQVNKVEGGAESESAGTEGEPQTEAAEPDVLAELEVLAKKIHIIEVPEGVEVPSGLKESSIQIGDAKVTGWIRDGQDKPEYCVLYGMNEDGEQNFYRYDLKENTVQRLFADEWSGSSKTESDAEKSEGFLSGGKLNVITAVLGGAVVLLLIALAVVLAGRGRKRVSYDSYEKESPREKKVPVRTAGGRKLSKEEQYMMGEEEEYLEEDPEDYMPEEAEPEAYIPEEEIPEEDVEQAIAKNLAKEAAAAAKEPENEKEAADDEEDDFEFFDL